MILRPDREANFGRLHRGEECVDLPLVLFDGQLAALGQIARSEGRTIGQMIRLALGLHLARECNCCDFDRTSGEARIDSPLDGPVAVEVMLLLPRSRMAALEALASRRGTTTGPLIRRVIGCSLLVGSSIRPPLAES
jgi:hypothetical protein